VWCSTKDQARHFKKETKIHKNHQKHSYLFEEKGAEKALKK